MKESSIVLICLTAVFITLVICSTLLLLNGIDHWLWYSVAMPLILAVIYVFNSDDTSVNGLEKALEEKNDE